MEYDEDEEDEDEIDAEMAADVAEYEKNGERKSTYKPVVQAIVAALGEDEQASVAEEMGRSSPTSSGRVRWGR